MIMAGGLTSTSSCFIFNVFRPTCAICIIVGSLKLYLIKGYSIKKLTGGKDTPFLKKKRGRGSKVF